MEIGRKSIGQVEHVLSWRTQCGGNREEINRADNIELILLVNAGKTSLDAGMLYALGKALKTFEHSTELIALGEARKTARMQLSSSHGEGKKNN